MQCRFAGFGALPVGGEPFLDRGADICGLPRSAACRNSRAIIFMARSSRSCGNRSSPMALPSLLRSARRWRYRANGLFFPSRSRPAPAATRPGGASMRARSCSTARASSRFSFLLCRHRYLARLNSAICRRGIRQWPGSSQAAEARHRPIPTDNGGAARPVPSRGLKGVPVFCGDCQIIAVLAVVLLLEKHQQIVFGRQDRPSGVNDMALPRLPAVLRLQVGEFAPVRRSYQSSVIPTRIRPLPRHVKGQVRGRRNHPARTARCDMCLPALKAADALRVKSLIEIFEEAQRRLWSGDRNCATLLRTASPRRSRIHGWHRRSIPAGSG